MAFGRNPHVTKALAAEMKAKEAPDDASRARALREAAHLWERAAERETMAPRRSEYEANAARNRDRADAGAAAEEVLEPRPAERDPKVWN